MAKSRGSGTPWEVSHCPHRRHSRDPANPAGPPVSGDGLQTLEEEEEEEETENRQGQNTRMTADRLEGGGPQVGSTRGQNADKVPEMNLKTKQMKNTPGNNQARPVRLLNLKTVTPAPEGEKGVKLNSPKPVRSAVNCRQSAGRCLRIPRGKGAQEPRVLGPGQASLPSDCTVTPAAEESSAQKATAKPATPAEPRSGALGEAEGSGLPELANENTGCNSGDVH